MAKAPEEFLIEAAKKLAEPDHAGLRKDLSIFIDYWGLDSYHPPERVETRVREIIQGFVTAAQMLAHEAAE